VTCSMAGKYVGASGSASLDVGVGANALIGGSHRSIALQALSVEAQVGVNLALGIAGLTLCSCSATVSDTLSDTRPKKAAPLHYANQVDGLSSAA
jgi:hypothetical protein